MTAGTVASDKVATTAGKGQRESSIDASAQPRLGLFAGASIRGKQLSRIGVAVATAVLVLTAAACGSTAASHPSQAHSTTADCPQYTTCPPLTSAERKHAASYAAAVQKSNAAGPTASPSPVSPSPDIELTVCAHFAKLVFPGIAATLSHAVGTGTPNPPYSKAEATLLRDDLKLSRWSYLVQSQAADAAFANYLGDAGMALGVVAAPYSTAAQAQTAARDVGTVNGYCKYDAS